MEDLRYLILGIVWEKDRFVFLPERENIRQTIKASFKKTFRGVDLVPKVVVVEKMVLTVNDKVVRLPTDRKRLAKSPFRRQLCWTTWPTVDRYWEALQKQSIILSELNVVEQNPIICLASAWTYNMKSGWTTQTGQFKWKLKTVLLSYRLSPWSSKRALLFTSITQGFLLFFLLFNSFYRSWCLVDWSESSLGSYR